MLDLEVIPGVEEEVRTDRLFGRFSMEMVNRFPGKPGREGIRGLKDLPVINMDFAHHRIGTPAGDLFAGSGDVLLGSGRSLKKRQDKDSHCRKKKEGQNTGSWTGAGSREGRTGRDSYCLDPGDRYRYWVGLDL